MANDVVVHQIGALQSAADVARNMDVIRDLMKTVLRDEVHYGKIPGCGDKPALLQPGGQKLAQLFNLAPGYRIETRDDDGGAEVRGHREYEVVCTLTLRTTGMVVGEGVGTCSTMESKYRYRFENTGADVPKAYWDTRDPDLIGGRNYSARKVWEGAANRRKQVWRIFERVAHDNPADYYNTCLKIAKKRAFLDAVLTATAASDIFMPDDDTDPEALQGRDESPAPPDDGGQPPAGDEPMAKAAPSQKIGQGARNLLMKKLGDAGLTDIDLCAWAKIGVLADLTVDRMNAAMDWIKNPVPAQAATTEGGEQ